MRRPLLLLTLGACGRIGFDAPGDSGAADTGEDGSYRSAVLADQPVGYWRFGEAGRIGDELGGPDGAATGGCMGDPGAIAGDPDRSLRFDGSCVVDLGPGFSFLGMTPYTVEAWISSESAGGFEHVVTRQLRDEFDPLDGYALLDSPTGVYFERVTSTPGGSFTQRQLSIMGRFTHAVGVFDGTQSHLYLDGVELGPATTDTGTATPYAANLLVGAARQGSGSLVSFFRGRIDEVAIYDHAVPPARIARHYQIGNGQ